MWRCMQLETKRTGSRQKLASNDGKIKPPIKKKASKGLTSYNLIGGSYARVYSILKIIKKRTTVFVCYKDCIYWSLVLGLKIKVIADKRTAIKLIKCFGKLCLRVHDNRASPGDRLVERTCLHDQNLRAAFGTLER